MTIIFDAVTIIFDAVKKLSTITDKINGTFTKLHHLDKNRDSYKNLPSPTPLNNVAKQCWTICQHCQGWSKEGELCVDRSLEI